MFVGDVCGEFVTGVYTGDICTVYTSWMFCVQACDVACMVDI